MVNMNVCKHCSVGRLPGGRELLLRSKERKSEHRWPRGWGSLKLQDLSLQKENLWAPFPSEGKGGMTLRFVSTDRILLGWQRHQGRHGAPVYTSMSGYSFPRLVRGSRTRWERGSKVVWGLRERSLGKGLSTSTYCEKENKGTEAGPCPKEV